MLSIINRRTGLGLQFPEMYQPVAPLTSSVPSAVTGNVGVGFGGSASSYTFDANGLSNDPRLTTNLQSLTYAQLQTALTPDPTGDAALQSSIDAINNLVSSGVSCDGTDCGSGITPPSMSLPTWIWIAGAALLTFALVEGSHR